MYKIKAYTAKTSSKKYWCQCNLWTGDFPAYIVGCLITCSTHQIARSSGRVIWSVSVEPISLAASANFGSWRSLCRAWNLKKKTAIRKFVHGNLLRGINICSGVCTTQQGTKEYIRMYYLIQIILIQRGIWNRKSNFHSD